MTPHPNTTGAIIISPERVYEEVRRLTEAVTRLESKVDGFITEAKDIRTDVADHEHRIRVLESTRWPLPALAILIAAASIIVTLYTR